MSENLFEKRPRVRTRELGWSNEKGVSGWGLKLIPICTSIKFNFFYRPSIPSHNPPKCGDAQRGIKCHVIPWLSIKCWIHTKRSTEVFNLFMSSNLLLVPDKHNGFSEKNCVFYIVTSVTQAKSMSNKFTYTLYIIQ